MAYLYCKHCHWEQDDFWTESYNPIKYPLEWEEALLGEKFNEKFTTDPEFLKEYGDLKYREVIAIEMERSADTIRNMKWRTYIEYKKDKAIGNGECPVCGNDNLEID